MHWAVLSQSEHFLHLQIFFTEMFLIQPQHMGKESIKTSNLLIPQKCQGLPFTSLRP